MILAPLVLATLSAAPISLKVGDSLRLDDSLPATISTSAQERCRPASDGQKLSVDALVAGDCTLEVKSAKGSRLYSLKVKAAAPPATPGPAADLSVTVPAGERREVKLGPIDSLTTAAHPVAELALASAESVEVTASGPGTLDFPVAMADGKTLLLRVVVPPPSGPQVFEFAEAIAVGQGMQQVRTFASVARVAVGDPSVMEVKVLGPTELLLVGVGAGQTTVLVWGSDGKRIQFVATVRGHSGGAPSNDLR